MDDDPNNLTDTAAPGAVDLIDIPGFPGEVHFVDLNDVHMAAVIGAARALELTVAFGPLGLVRVHVDSIDQVLAFARATKRRLPPKGDV